MNPVDKRALIFSIPVIFAVLLLGGWLLLRGQSSVQNASKEPVLVKMPVNQSPSQTTESPEVVRDKKITSIIAHENNEPESGVHLSFLAATDHHMRGQAFLDSDARKKVFFLATDVFRDPSLPSGTKQELKYGEWSVSDGPDEEQPSCQFMRDYFFPKNMMAGCVENTGEVSSGVIVVSKRWHLVSGDSKDSCTRPTYEGSVVIRGWYEWRTNYVGKEWMLVVNKADESKLVTGFPWSLSFKLNNASPELEEELKNATPDKPVSLTVKKLGYYCEGSPWLDL